MMTDQRVRRMAVLIWCPIAIGENLDAVSIDALSDAMSDHDDWERVMAAARHYLAILDGSQSPRREG